MTEKLIKEALDFLCVEYSFCYDFQELKGFHGGNNSLYVYSFYNENGCFSIKNYPVIGDVVYFCINSIDSLNDYLSANQSIQIKHQINIYTSNIDIWKKHRLKLFFSGYKKELQVLAEVIKAQIAKNGEFFGIKVNK